MSESETLATRIAARIVGPLLLLVGAVVIARQSDFALLIPGILSDGPLAFITGVFTLICGATLLAFHHHWKSPAAIVISFLALATIVRGVTLMFAPDVLAGLVHAAITGAGPALIIAGAVTLLIGAWLSFIGWFAKRAGGV